MTYTITVANAGPSNAAGATVADTFPRTTFTCTWHRRAAGPRDLHRGWTRAISTALSIAARGQQRDLYRQLPIAPGATGSLDHNTRDRQLASGPDPTGQQLRHRRDTLARLRRPVVTKIASPIPSRPARTWPTPSPSPTVARAPPLGHAPDTLPAGATFVSRRARRLVLHHAAGWRERCSLLLYRVAGAGSAVFTLTVAVSPLAPGDSTISNTAAVSSTTSDPNSTNDAATETTTVATNADLSITKTDGVTSVTTGGPVTYTIVVSNAGPLTATNATVTDTFPADLTGVTWTCTAAGGATCGTPNGSGAITTTVILPPGGTTTFTASGTVATAAGASLANTASVTAPRVDRSESGQQHRHQHRHGRANEYADRDADRHADADSYGDRHGHRHGDWDADTDRHCHHDWDGDTTCDRLCYWDRHAHGCASAAA